MAVPPYVAAARALRFAARQLAQHGQSAHDVFRCTYLAGGPERLIGRSIKLSPENVPPELLDVLPKLCEHYIAHRFDLLGSGWIEVRHGMDAAGIEGHKYAPAPVIAADRDGNWLRQRTTPSNFPYSRALWRLIDQPHRPIDWQIDFKSGYRWNERRHFRKLRFGNEAGADVKVPWELARLQHLPQLAVAHVLALAGERGFAEPRIYAREVRNQILDFLAANPPRFGVNWLCPMDVGIRAANMVVAVDILRAAGWQPDEAFEAVLARAVLTHGRHIIDNLEWSPEPRSNHYLSDLAGLLFCAAYLPASAETDAWLAFGARQLGDESQMQFLKDGGNFEGSTNYHRLSTELVLYSTSLLLGIADERAKAFSEPPAHRLRVRVPSASGPFPTSNDTEGRPVPLAQTVIARLEAAWQATFKWIKPDGRPPQIGDTDSGRLFKFHPAVTRSTSDEVVEDCLNHCSLLATGAALFAGETNVPSARQWLDRAVVAGFSKGRRLPRSRAPPSGNDRRGDEEDLHNLRSKIDALEAACVRTAELRLPGLESATLRRYALDDFGLFVFSGPETFVSLRCMKQPCIAHTMGHTHDDNLAIDVQHRGTDLICDPGSYVYTPLPLRRDLYRSASAHFAPRPANGAAAAEAVAPFAMRHRATARCIYFGPSGTAAVLEGPGWRTFRIMRFVPDALIITDGCSAGPLAAVHPIAVSEGYGCLAERLSILEPLPEAPMLSQRDLLS
jgi:Heparinase II/III N-terminus/Heparinase II/III-like protein